MIQKAKPTETRCAIYTRISVDDQRADQTFDSIEAQRESCESYVASQKSQGWTCLPTRYDDRGISGATTDRPALQRLLADVAAGEVEVVVVQRVDRLSRSLLGFSRIVDVLEKSDCSLVSVNQRFDTTDSMGRLTLNMLLSFAQFERELIAERTRDKSHAARRRGKFTGSTPPLGYDIAPEGGRLVVNVAEAERVREIFGLYLRRGTLIRTVGELNARGWTTKRWVSKKGTVVGGTAFVSTSLYSLLTNATLAGLVRFGGELFPGEHVAVVDEALWNRVQERLKSNRNGDGRSTRRSKYPGLLKNLLRCTSCDCPMIHTYSRRDTRLYRYYVCERAGKQGYSTCPTRSLPAAEIERYVVDELAAIGRDEAVVAETARQARELANVEVVRLEAERAGVEKALRALGEDLRKAVAGPIGGLDPARLTALQEQIATAHARISQIGQELEQARASHLDESDLRAALADFDGVWGEMSGTERARVLTALVERVAYDGPKGEIAITFRPTGIRALAGEVKP